jgi:hypothetical protein
MNDDSRMKEAQKIMAAFQRQTERLQNPQVGVPENLAVGSNEFDNQGGDVAGHGDGNNVGMGFDNQGPPQETTLVNPSRPVSGPFPNQTAPTPQPPAATHSTNGGSRSSIYITRNMPRM